MRDKPEGADGSLVWVDDRKIGVMATGHLLRLGHRRIAVMLSEPLDPSSSRRLTGWREAMRAANQKGCDDLIVDCSVNSGEDAIVGSYERLLDWLKRPKCEFTALFCVSWTGALAAMRALRENGMEVPRDVSLITYGSEGAFSEFLNPPLTTVRTEVRQHAIHAVRLVKEALTQERWNSEKVIVEAHIVERKSTRRLKR
jgi:LacI family transcriptional regulator